VMAFEIAGGEIAGCAAALPMLPKRAAGPVLAHRSKHLLKLSLS
jgi:hypothetical protein